MNKIFLCNKIDTKERLTLSMRVKLFNTYKKISVVVRFCDSKSAHLKVALGNSSSYAYVKRGEKYLGREIQK